MKPTDRLIFHLMDRDRSMVRDPDRGQAAAVRSFAILFGALLASLALRWWYPGGPLEVVGEVVVALLAGVAVTNGIRAKLAYRHGWLEGRQQMVSALAEAQRRNLPPAVWLEGELQRDQAVLGIPLTVFPEEDGEEGL